MAFEIKQDTFEAALAGAVRAALEEAAEPVIEEAVRQFEGKARQRIGSLCLGLIQSDYRLERMGTDIVIRVAFGGKKEG